MAFTHYKSVTIDPTQCGASNSTDFPVSIWITDADFAALAFGGKSQNAFGFDIRPYPNTVPSSALTFELVPGTYVAMTGTFEMHVKLSTVSHTVPTVFYLFVGDAALTTDGSSTATWDSHFIMVYHFADGTTPNYSDSSQYGNTLIGVTTGVAAGRLDGAFSFTPPCGLSVPSIGHSAAVTISHWVNFSALGVVQLLMSRDGSPRYFQWRVNSSDVLEFIPFISGSPVFVQGATTLSTGTAYYAAAVTDGTDGFVYLNNVQDGTTPTGALDTGGTDDVEIGVRAAANYLNANYLDELRYSDIARSPDWLLTEYNNQKAGSTFLTFGALTPVGGGSTPTTRLPLLGVG